MKVVFDTVVVLRAYINPQNRWGRLLARHTNEYRLVVSPPIVAEYLDVLLRPELSNRFSSLATLPTASLFGQLAQAEVVRPTDVPSVSRDPDDDIFFATTRRGGADYIVSEDKDQLDVGEYEGIKVVTAGEFLRILAEQDRRGQDRAPHGR
ncbi:MAG TPA: putative toxin-antitoxin system toxin component, PIN family [Thermomicrobiales bacterium]